MIFQEKKKRKKKIQGQGYFVHYDAGNVDYNNKQFNNAVAETSSTETNTGEVAASGGAMGESLLKEDVSGLEMYEGIADSLEEAVEEINQATTKEELKEADNYATKIMGKVKDYIMELKPGTRGSCLALYHEYEEKLYNAYSSKCNELYPELDESIQSINDAMKCLNLGYIK